MTGITSKERQPVSNDSCSSIAESLEQLASASQRLADLIADAAGIQDVGNECEDGNPDENASRILSGIFDAGSIDGYDGSEVMERARVAHLNAALEMYTVMATPLPQEFDPTLPDNGESVNEEMASRIGHALRKELMEYYTSLLHGNDRVIFTTEQRTALESAFLLKPKLNTAEKRALAKTCNLNPRQVEVWVRAHLNC
jgi:hypothetical protein